MTWMTHAEVEQRALSGVRVLALGGLDEAGRLLAGAGAEVLETGPVDPDQLEELIRETDVLIGAPGIGSDRLLEINAGLVALVGDERPRGVGGAYAVMLALYRRDACCGSGRVIG